MTRLFAASRIEKTAAAELNRLTAGEKWADFKPEN